MHVQTTFPLTYILFFLSHKFENGKKMQGRSKKATPKPDKGGGGKT
jgi:hypothetical protein